MRFNLIFSTRLFIVVLALLAGLFGCDEEPAPEGQPTPEQQAKTRPDTPSADAGEPSKRLAFGLPLPPNATILSDHDSEVRIKVRMPLKEVGAFFEANLVDYEILYPHDQVRVVGLRGYMPEAYAYPYGPFTFVVYSPAKSAPDEAADAEDDAALAKAPTAKRPSTTSYEKGDPILERTADGELLAPGARWGEPYTPPPGSPLHKLHFRSNFGRPYGQWTLR